MYSNCSTHYWNKRQKPWYTKKTKLTYVLVFLVMSMLLINDNTQRRKRRRKEQQEQQLRSLHQQRPNKPTDEQYKLCELNMRDSINSQCAKLCNGELNSIPRPLMYEACNHGCSRSIYSAAIVGCKMGSIEDAYHNENREQAMNSCSRYQHVEPTPFVSSTCRKYYREGTKTGRNLGYGFINEMVEIHWERKKSEI